MPFLPRAAAGQLRFLVHDCARAVNGRHWRWLTVPFSPGFAAIAAYRLNRSLYLAFGPAWKACRVLLAPVSFVLRPWFGHAEIHLEAEIGPGFHLLHPALGAVISKYAVLGADVTLTGGNCIGTRGAAVRKGDIRIGSRVTLGANAVVLGPVCIGDDAVIAAGAVAVRDVEAGAVVAGVPAQPLRTRTPVSDRRLTAVVIRY